MPFDGSGNFSRLYNWVNDRNNSINILASRMDGEFDNFAGGMNVVFFRSGLVPMSGNFNLGQNYIIGAGAGSVGALSMRFNDDATTGYYLDGVGKFCIAAAGVKRLEVNTTGVLVTGTFNASGAITQNGVQTLNRTDGLSAKAGYGPAGAGYGAGIGQTISKATAVTLNKLCGAVVTHNAALAGGATVNFTINNNQVEATDTCVLAINAVGGGNPDDYDVRVRSVVAGAINVALANRTVGSLSQSVTINFTVIKGVTT